MNKLVMGDGMMRTLNSEGNSWNSTPTGSYSSLLLTTLKNSKKVVGKTTPINMSLYKLS
jgi:hypothetical protein